MANSGSDGKSAMATCPGRVSPRARAHDDRPVDHPGEHQEEEAEDLGRDGILDHRVALLRAWPARYKAGVRGGCPPSAVRCPPLRRNMAIHHLF